MEGREGDIGKTTVLVTDTVDLVIKVTAEEDSVAAEASEATTSVASETSEVAALAVRATAAPGSAVIEEQ